MNLREQAESDFGMIIEDKSFGFGWDIILINPDGLTAPLVGLSNDISLAVDPDTGMLVSGRTATVALRLSSLRAAGFDTNPRNISENNRRPWVVLFKDINGVPYVFKVMKSNPDRAIGAITLILEAYRQGELVLGKWTFPNNPEYAGLL